MYKVSKLPGTLRKIFCITLISGKPSTAVHITAVKHEQLEEGKTEEIHKVPSTKALQTATTSKPWGIAFDALHHIVWVAEPGCEPRPTCLKASPGIIGQYDQLDGSWIQDFPEPSGYTRPTFIALAADGTVWFTEPYSALLVMWPKKTVK